MPNEIIFTKKMLEELELAYGKAMANDYESFMFENQEILTQYAKYLIQYLEKKLNEQ